MKKVFLLLSLAISIAMVSCNTKDSGGDPTKVLALFFDAMQKNDFAKAKEFATPESKPTFALMELARNGGKNNIAKYDTSKVEFGTAIINGDNAKVPIKEKTNGESVNFPMKKINGEWKVAFDANSLMELATDKMKEKNINLNDSLGGLLNKMKGLNVDSMQKTLMKQMKDSKIDMDSLQKEMDKAMKGVNVDDMKKALEEHSKK